jgi:hypothetical protein
MRLFIVEINMIAEAIAVQLGGRPGLTARKAGAR